MCTRHAQCIYSVYVLRKPKLLTTYTVSDAMVKLCLIKPLKSHKFLLCHG